MMKLLEKLLDEKGMSVGYSACLMVGVFMLFSPAAQLLFKILGGAAGLMAISWFGHKLTGRKWLEESYTILGPLSVILGLIALAASIFFKGHDWW